MDRRVVVLRLELFRFEEYFCELFDFIRPVDLLPRAAHPLRRASPPSDLFTGTVAKVASLIAIVVGGYEFAHGEPGAKKDLAGVAAGTGIAVLATNILTWLWGI